MRVWTIRAEIDHATGKPGAFGAFWADPEGLGEDAIPLSAADPTVALLRRWLAFHTEAAGMTPEIVHDRAKFVAFNDDIQRRQDALVADTRAALAVTL